MDSVLSQHDAMVYRFKATILNWHRMWALWVASKKGLNLHLIEHVKLPPVHAWQPLTS